MAIGVVLLVVVVVLAKQLGQGRDAKPLPGTVLRELGRERGVFVGTAVRDDVLGDNKAYRQVVAAQFSSVTPENEMKWGFLEAKRGEFRFAPADAIVDAAQKAGQAVRGHALVFHNQLPGWVEGLDRAELSAAMRDHIQRVVDRYRGRVALWDVVNEALTDDGGLRPSPFLDKLGPDYIEQAFRIARRADPKAKLYINDIGAEGINAKSDRLYDLVRSLKARGVPIDGVGFQTHVNLQGVQPTYVENLRRFAALGVEVAITEADVGIKLPVSAGELRAQARIFAQIVRGCLSVKACRYLTFWGFTDGHSWIPKTQPGMGAATLLDQDLRAKPAFRAVQRALRP